MATSYLDQLNEQAAALCIEQGTDPTNDLDLLNARCLLIARAAIAEYDRKRYRL